MEKIRCKNCGYTVNIPSGSDEYVECPACGSVLRVTGGDVARPENTKDVRAWREYMANRLHAQADSGKPDYVGVKLFAQKILFAEPDDFRAQYYCALADRFIGSGEAFLYFLNNSRVDGATSGELREVVDSLISTVTPEYLAPIRAFIMRAYPDTYRNFDIALDRHIESNRRNAVVSAARDVFICYGPSALGGEVALAACERLEERGLRCWIAPRNILAGSGNSERDIIKGIEGCNLFLFVADAGSASSDECERRLKTAADAGKPVLVYDADGTPYGDGVAGVLDGASRLDASDEPYAHLEELVIEAKNALAAYSRELAEKERTLSASREAEREYELERSERERERLANFDRADGLTKMPVSDMRNKLKRAELELKSGSFDRAERIIDEVLDADPENGLAWWLLILTDNRARTDDDLVESGIDFTSSGYLDNALKFAAAQERKRINGAVERAENFTVKSVATALREASALLDREDFSALEQKLDSVSRIFADERSLVYTRFPDIASTYFRLKLWAKYGQTYRVCVEDITREREFASALRYASPAQKLELERERDTVAENARQFLRERSKDAANDGKISDYLLDNKNILPDGVYNFYSSLLYFRKMLNMLNMTEEKLRTTCIDITTNEYFLLAQALATDGQREEYDELVRTLAANREARRREVENAAGATAANDDAVKARHKWGAIATCVISYTLFVSALVLLGARNTAALGLFIGAAAARLINDVIGYGDAAAVRTRVMNGFNLAASIVTIVLVAVNGIAEGTALFNLTIVASVATIVVEGINSSKIRRINRKNRDDDKNGGNGNGGNG